MSLQRCSLFPRFRSEPSSVCIRTDRRILSIDVQFSHVNAVAYSTFVDLAGPLDPSGTAPWFPAVPRVKGNTFVAPFQASPGL
jgi:hypothetical protein